MFGEMMQSLYLDDWHLARFDVGLLLVDPALFDNEELSLVCWYWVISLWPEQGFLMLAVSQKLQEVNGTDLNGQ